MHSEEPPSQGLPICPSNQRVIFNARQEALFDGDMEVALGRYEIGVGIEETNGDFPRYPAVYICRRSIIRIAIRGTTGYCDKKARSRRKRGMDLTKSFLFSNIKV